MSESKSTKTWQSAKSELVSKLWDITRGAGKGSKEQEAELTKARLRLEKLWFPYFDDAEKEAAFVAEVVHTENMRYLCPMWFFLTIGLIYWHGSDYFSLAYFGKDGLSRAGIVGVCGSMYQVITVQMLIVYRFMYRLCMASDVFLTVFAVLAIVSCFAVNWWRIGTAAVGDGNYLWNEAGQKADGDTLLLLSLTLLAAINNVVLQVRAIFSFLISAMVPLSYLIFSLPKGWCPHSTTSAIHFTLMLGLVSGLLWTAQRRSEVQLRTNWLRMRELTNEVATLNAIRTNVAKTDTPGDASSPMGSWTLKWVGPHVFKELRRSLGVGMLDLGKPRNRLSRRLSRVGKSVEHHSQWVINASPFDVKFFFAKNPMELAAYMFCEMRAIPQEDLDLQVSSPWTENSSWKRLQSSAMVRVDAAGWSKEGFDNEVARVHLPSRDDGHRLGSLKCVRGPDHIFLIVWSPPAEVRGMPLLEFEEFLSKVIDCPGEWDCATFLPDGSKGITCKAPGDRRRNMYDACANLIMPTVARVDSSYAELRTNFGPPTLFGSHVWGEGAGTTLKAIRSFNVGEKGAVSTSVGKVRSITATDGTSSFVQGNCRIWFCTCCNNQMRVAEELGTDVSLSPFARVIKSDLCKQIAVISPLLALSRKWCNFEFALGHDENVEVSLATASGIVQAGQVAPKALHKLAMHLEKFSCANATCTSPDDEALIDHAIAQMGGYEELDANLRTTFTQAILTAHEWTSQALVSVCNSQQVRTRLSQETSLAKEGFRRGSLRNEKQVVYI